jgi:hypothetical protein
MEQVHAASTEPEAVRPIETKTGEGLRVLQRVSDYPRLC